MPLQDEHIPNDFPSQPVLARARVSKAPVDTTDEVQVTLINYSANHMYEIPAGSWQARGVALPVEGDLCVVGLDDDHDAWLLGWTGQNEFPPFPPFPAEADPLSVHIGAAAGGDLGGTYPNPSVVRVNGHAASGIMFQGETAGGDLGGTYPNPSVVSVGGRPASGVTSAVDAVPSMVPVGAIVPYAGSSLPAGGKWDWADGGLIDRTVNATFFGLVGHAYNGGVDPGSNMVRKPDKRGRVSVGADNFGAGAAGRLTTVAGHNNARGQNGGEERHTTALAEVPVHSHGGGAHAHNQQEWSVLVANTGPTATIVGNSAGGANVGIKNDFMSGSGTIIGNDGSGSPHNNVQPYEVDNYLVRIA